jgi:hypothetical protein
MRNGKDPDADPYLWLTNPDPPEIYCEMSCYNTYGTYFIYYHVDTEKKVSLIKVPG